MTISAQTGLEVPSGRQQEWKPSTRHQQELGHEQQRQKLDSHLLPTSPVAKAWARRVEREKAQRWLSLFKLVKFLPTTGSDEGLL